ncbi:hypothetical protein [Gordonia rhizosphera]|uniref:Uncharacterized protein n=1 Tax=Gordonia rhizosphera NBRC 16068 TaxID=1108045 RepID=K6W7B4_9ACTN|nr:hypothetical protein [Gordonia rhizosphera]GAB88112.1 hypothetical protein GORHZ_003_00140 [Gordonia rhizosphera NBRC 16068]
MPTTVRTRRFVEDLAPGDRISIDGHRGVVKTALPNDDGDLVISLVNSSEERDEVVLSVGTKVDIL